MPKWERTLVPLLAALVGAVATLGGVLATGCQQTRAEEKALERAQARELRTASRLIQDELTDIHGHLGILVARRFPILETVPEREEYLADVMWQQYKDVIAASDIPDAQWEKLTAIYSNITGLRRTVRLTKPGEPEPPADFWEGVEALQKEVSRAHKELGQLTPE